MPYKVYKDGDKWCVHKLTNGTKGPVVKGGCHPTKSEADNHQRALQVNVQGSRLVTYEPLTEEPLLSTVYNVDMCAVGIEYPLASGPMTFTQEDLIEAVASQDDPAVRPPRAWLGHVDDDRFHAGRSTPAGSAEPALGKFINLRVEDQGMTLVGDIVGCPTWLARILASAYPSRSIEGGKGVITATGHEWKMVVTDVALLGVRWPGVSTLADLEALYSEEGPDDIEIIEEDPLTIAAAAGRITAQVDVDDVRRAYYSEAPSEQTWWWIRAIQLNPTELIVDDDEGGLYRVPFAVSGDDVTFSDPVQVKIEYVTASQASDPDARGLIARTLTTDSVVAASWDQRAESRPESSNQEDQGMTPEQIRLLRARLNLSEDQLPNDATPEQITAVLSAETAPETPPSETPETPDPSEQPNMPEEPEEPEVATPDAPESTPEQIAAARATLQRAGLVAVPGEAWATVQANAAAGARVAQQSDTESRDRITAQAVRDGRIAPHQRQHFRQMFDRDPQGTNTLLTATVEKGGLMPGTIPIEARGSDPSPDMTTSEAYPSSWLPELQAGATPDRITVEG